MCKDNKESKRILDDGASIIRSPEKYRCGYSRGGLRWLKN